MTPRVAWVMLVLAFGITNCKFVGDLWDKDAADCPNALVSAPAEFFWCKTRPVQGAMNPTFVIQPPCGSFICAHNEDDALSQVEWLAGETFPGASCEPAGGSAIEAKPPAWTEDITACALPRKPKPDPVCLPDGAECADGSPCCGLCVDGVCGPARGTPMCGSVPSGGLPMGAPCTAQFDCKSCICDANAGGICW